MIIASVKSLLNLSILSNLIELRPSKVLFNHVALLMKGEAFRRVLLEECFVFVGIEEGHNHVQSCEDYNIQALMEELLFSISFGDGDASCKYGST